MIDAIISIKSKYADLILEGKKIFEVRRSKLPTDRVWRFYIYSSGIEKKVVGSCSLCYRSIASDSLLKSHKDSLLYRDWRSQVLDGLCITEKELSDYVGSSLPFVYAVRDVVRFTEPFDLIHFGLTHAPQSWSYAKCIPANLLGGFY